MKRARRILPVLLLLLLAAGFFLRADPAFLRDRRDAKQYPPEQFLADRLDREAERVYLAAYDLSAQELEKLWTEVYNNRPDLFFVSASYEFSTFNDRVLYVSPRYEVGLQRNDDARRRYQDALQTAVSGVEEDWSDLEKALYLHDWIVLHAAYDDTLAGNSAYDLLVSGTGVCQAYAKGYLALLQQCGIPCRLVTSEEMMHAWVIVELDGSWYNVDPTHDDPTFDRLGYVQHTYFLKSDAALRDSHFGAESPIGCVSTAYDDASWNQVRSAFIPLDGTFYCIAGNRLCRWDGKGLMPLYTVSDRWYVSGDPNAYWDGCFSILAAHGDGLLFNTPNAIMRYDPAAGRADPVYLYDGPGALYGFTARDGTLTCQAADSPNEAGTQFEITLDL